MMKSFTFAVLAGVFVPQLAAAAEQTAEDIHKKALGQWERELEYEGQNLRMVKDIGEKKETVSVYNADGELVSQWTLDYKIEIIPSRVSVFHMLDREYTAGQRKGEKITEPRAYAFRIHDDRWHEIHNLPLDADGRPRFNVFKRVSGTSTAENTDDRDWQDEEWSKLVGVWRAPDPRVGGYRIKRITKGKEILEYYNSQGELLATTETNMKIERHHGLNFFTVRSGTPRQYTSIYKVHDGKWYEQLRGIFADRGRFADSRNLAPNAFLVYERVEE